MTYSILDSDNQCINHVLWDGTSDWQPPEGCTLVEGALNIGHSYRFDDALQQWVDLTPPPPLPAPAPQWVQFGAALSADPAVNAMVAVAATSAPVLHLMLGVGLGQAAQGDPQTFSVAWANARAVDLVSAELAAHVAAVGASYDLPAEFLASLEAVS